MKLEQLIFAAITYLHMIYVTLPESKYLIFFQE